MKVEIEASTAERLAEAMRIRNVKQADLVRMTGIDKASISLYISGKYSPKGDKLYKLAVALNVAPAWLSGFNVSMEPESDAKPKMTPEEALEKLKQGRKNTFVLMGHGGSGGHDVIRMNEDEFNAVKSVLETMRKNQQQRNKKQSKE